MPKLGESVHEGTIEQWLVSVGDEVGEYEPLCEVITDKVTAEVPSTVSGVVTELIVNEGETVNVDAVICKIDTGEEKDESELSQTDETQPENDGARNEATQRKQSSDNKDQKKNLL